MNTNRYILMCVCAVHLVLFVIQANKCTTYTFVYIVSTPAFCGHSSAEIVGSNPAGGTDVCLL